MFFGEYSHQIDAKGRLRMPSKLKASLGTEYVITKGTGGCLYVFTPAKLVELQEKFKSVELLDNSAQNAIRVIWASAYDVVEDPQGRFLLPAKLREHAGIQKNLITIGVGDRAEIWAEERWNEINEKGSYDETVGELSRYKI